MSSLQVQSANCLGWGKVSSSFLNKKVSYRDHSYLLVRLVAKIQKFLSDNICICSHLSFQEFQTKKGLVSIRRVQLEKFVHSAYDKQNVIPKGEIADRIGDLLDKVEDEKIKLDDFWKRVKKDAATLLPPESRA